MPDSDSSDASLKSAVRTRYANIATENGSCCGPSGGGGEEDLAVDVSEDYAEGIADQADLNLGCGRPTDSADLRRDERVLDLGSGAGMDAFVARRDVGPDGHVHGVDLAEEMVEKARANADTMGYDNVTFDAILSNCVLNLVPDKPAAFGEMHRVLRVGDRFAVSDIVHVGSFPGELRGAVELYVGCVAGAMKRGTYLRRLRESGFADVQVAAETPIPLPDGPLAEYLGDEQVSDFRSGDAALRSVTVMGRRPDG